MFTLKENSHIISTVAFVSNYGQEENKRNAFYGNTDCTQGRICLYNMTQEQIYNACVNHYNQKSFWFDILFYKGTL